LNATQYAGLSDTGRTRPHNEDSMVFLPELGLAVVADGMGAHAAGEVASQIAVDTVLSIMRLTAGAAAVDRLETAVTAAHAAIREKAQSSIRFDGMGTTVVMTFLHGKQLYHAHVGDSRLYRLHAGKLEQLTRDHSLLQESIDQGLYSPEEARARVARNILTRALGLDGELKVDVGHAEARSGDRFLLCSDGLYEMLPDSDIAALMQRTPDIKKLVQALVAMANERGGRDNITVIVIDIG
jgi:serine/threonine protein phosphatase PrpC